MTITYASHELVAIDIHNADGSFMSDLLNFLGRSEITPQRSSRPGDGPMFTAYFRPADAPKVTAWLAQRGIPKRATATSTTCTVSIASRERCKLGTLGCSSEHEVT